MNGKSLALILRASSAKAPVEPATGNKTNHLNDPQGAVISAYALAVPITYLTLFTI
jgi:hypothetical protein